MDTTVTIAIQNLAPANGTFLTPVWVGLHDGGFDSYNGGESLDAFPGTEALAEDGDTQPISAQFDAVGAGTVQATILGPNGPIAPGDFATLTLSVDGDLDSSRYFSYASMILPSNDAFIANGNPLAVEVFAEDGEFQGVDFVIPGSAVNDAGTEVNDELPANTAFFGQQTPNTGVDENGVVTAHPGFQDPGSGGILDDPQFVNADFTEDGYEVARVQILEGAFFPVTVTVENLAPDNGTSLTPVWVGFHDGGFDIYDRGVSLDQFPGTEALVEDGNLGPISDRFATEGAGTIQGAVFGANGPISPGETTAAQFLVESGDPSNRFFSYAAMILPSNDAFIANGNPEALPLFDEAGNFRPIEFILLGDRVLDGGTEVNDELPLNTAFFGQQTPNTGVDENGVVTDHPGFLAPGSGGILDDPQFANADFTAEGYEVVRITVTAANPIFPNAAPVELNATLSGNQEVPPVASAPAEGTSRLTLNESGTALTYELTVFGLDFGLFIDGTPQTSDPNDDVTRVHLHDGDFGSNGPVAFGLLDTVAPQFADQDSDDLQITLNDDGSVTLSGVWEQSDPASIALGNFVSELRTTAEGDNTGLYWNIHTAEFPAGAIRGQLAVDGEAPAPVFGTGDDDVFETGINAEPRLNLIFAGEGSDLTDLSTGFGDNRVYGGTDNDETLLGINDRAFGGPGNDILDSTLSRGGNRAYGGAGNDELFAGTQDRLFGNDGEDILDSTVGDGNNRLYGGNGNDLLLVGSNDRAIAGTGDDRIFLFGGENLVTGGFGTDQFWLTSGELPPEINTVTDFESGIDVLGVGGLGIDFSALVISVSDNNATISLDGTALALLTGVGEDVLSAADFVFA